MATTCPKCSGVFSSTYNFESHINKAISCDAVLKCDTCGKEFKKRGDYLNHINRKFPCKPFDKEQDLKLQVISEKTKQNTIRLEKEQTLKLEIIAEKNKQKDIRLEKEHNLKLAILEERQKNKIALEMKRFRVREKESNDRVIAKQKEQDILILKAEARLFKMRESERLKSERQARTPVEIKLDKEKELEKKFIESVEKEHLSQCYTSFKDIAKHRNNEYNTFIYNEYDELRSESEQAKLFLSIFHNNKSPVGMVQDIIKRSYTSTKYSDIRCVFSSEKLDSFYGVDIDVEGYKELRLLDYEQELAPELITTLNMYFEKIIEYGRYLDLSLSDFVTKLSSLEFYKKNLNNKDLRLSALLTFKS